MAKNGHLHGGRKVGSSDATANIFFSVDSYDLKSLSFKFGNDTFITFKMPRVLPTIAYGHGGGQQEK